MRVGCVREKAYSVTKHQNMIQSFSFLVNLVKVQATIFFRAY